MRYTTETVLRTERYDKFFTRSVPVFQNKECRDCNGTGREGSLPTQAAGEALAKLFVSLKDLIKSYFC